MMWPTDTLILWHGTDTNSATAIKNSRVRRITQRPGMKMQTWDFGAGFYTTTHRDKAVAWAQTRAYVSGRSGIPMLVRFEVPVQEFTNLEKLAFGDGGPGADLYWTFVAACRSGAAYHNPVKGWTFPAVVGPVSASIGPVLSQRTLVPDVDQISFHHPHGISFINKFPRQVETP
jgi:hypothetical protein